VGKKGTATAGAVERERGGTLRVVGMNPAHHGLGMASGALGQARGAPALRDVEQSQRPLAGAGVGCAQSQVPQVLRRLTPAREINT
jgi:hypothetical protein